MRRKVVGLAVTALLISGAAGSAAAQTRGYVGFGAGASLPIGSFGDGAKLGWLGQVIAGITGPGGMLGGRIDGMYARNSLKNTDGHFALFGFNADVVLNPGNSAAKARPYFLAGLGFFNSKATVAGVSGNGTTKLALNGGLGVNIHTSGQMAVYLEGRFITVRTGGGSTNFIPFSIGVRWGGL